MVWSHDEKTTKPCRKIGTTYFPFKIKDPEADLRRDENEMRARDGHEGCKVIVENVEDKHNQYSKNNISKRLQRERK